MRRGIPARAPAVAAPASAISTRRMASDSTEARRPCRDSTARSIVGHIEGRRARAWPQGSEVRGYSCSRVETELVVQVLGDAPRGTSLAIWIGADLKGAWQVA
jgi:hypothetical protein